VNREALTDPNAFWDVVYEDPAFRATMKKKVLEDCATGNPEKMVWENIPIVRDGQVVAYISARNTPVPEKNLMISTVWDVTSRIKAEEALRESEEKHRLMAENSLDVIWTADLEGNLTYVSPAVEKLLGFTPEEIIGMPFSDFVLRTDYDILLAKLREERAKAPAERVGPVTMEARNASRDNRVVYVEINASWIKDGQGNLTGIQGSTRDITERKHLEEQIIESKQMYRSVVDTQHEILCRYLPDTTLTFVNDAFCRSFGKPRSELLGQKFLRFIPPELQEEQRATLKRLSPSHPNSTREFVVTMPDGGTRWLEWTDIALYGESGALKEIQGVGSDITKRKIAEENLLKAYDATIEGWPTRSI
jgi:PAS domain S-box-containing protein